MLGRFNKKGLLASLVLILLVASGCQNISNVDVSKAMVQLVTEKSSEGTATITVEFVADPLAELSEESALFLDAFGKIQLYIHDLRAQDAEHVSMKGELVLGKGSIPLHMSMVKEEMSILVQGASAPVVFKMNNSLGFDSLGPLPLTEEIQNKLVEKFPEFSEKLIPFILSKASQPKKLSVSATTETINNEKLNVNKLSIETDGVELQSWLKNLLRDIVADESGTRELVGHLYDILGPDLIKKAGQGNAIISGILGNREQAVPLFTSVIQGLITNALVEMEENDDQPGMFDSVSNLSLNFYLDSELYTRKITAEMMITPDFTGIANSGMAGTELEGISAIKVSMQTERWNINKSVKADLLDLKGGLVIDENTEPQEILAHFDEQSLVYKLLKEDLRITRKAIPMPVGDYEEALDSEGQMPYIDKNNRTLAPARFVSELLGAEIKWNGDLQQVTITAPAVEKTIVLTIGSNVALVNGVEVEFDTAAVIVPPGFTYVPVRFIVETLGAEVKFNEATRTVFVITED